MKNNIKQIKKAFTLAEVLIVLTILGIIAAISMTTLRPAEFKARGMAVAAKKVLYDVDVATTELLLDYAQANTDAVIPSTLCNAQSLATEYKKKLSAIRQTGNCSGITYDSSKPNAFFLKSGACLAFGEKTTTATATRFPGETADTNDTASCGLIYFDTNGDDGPNVIGADRFIIPLDISGIKYAN